MGTPANDLVPTRRSLLSRLKNWEDEDGWKEFFDTYWKLIYTMAIKAGLTNAEAEEVVQETVIQVAKKMPDFKYDPQAGSFRSWLFHTTRWRVADQFRKRPKEWERNCPVERSAGTTTIERVPDECAQGFEALWDAEWTKSIFDTALDKVKRLVKARQYQMFDLYVVKQWPVQKVAKTLGVNIGQIYLVKHRISRLLKREIRNLERQ